MFQNKLDIRPLIGIVALILMISCGETEKQVTPVEVDMSTIEKHVKMLADDSFLGRKPFTEGETKTINYLKDQFELLGLEPGNGDSYFQEVPLVELNAQPSSEMIIEGESSDFKLDLGEDFVVFSERVSDTVSLEQSELVFAGYGVVAPEYNWNDYEGIDVKGKTVVVLVNDPGFGAEDSTLFKGKTMTYYGRWTYKYEEAARQGAAGCLIVHETIPAGYPWAVVENSWSGAGLYLDGGSDNYKCAVQGWITRDAAIEIFKGSGVDIKNYNAMARSEDFEAFSLNQKVSVGLTNGIKKSVSQNVVAKISGTETPDETIIYSAHWDHLGVGLELDGDSIYNGAHDNATGTAGLLSIAEAFSKTEKPKRTVVFLAVTAEEQGLLGSKYYADNPIYDVGKTVANINMDGLPYYGKMKDLTIVGYGQSDMDDLAATIAEKQGRYIIPDPDPGKGYFFRSDHFHFARVGIPALYASGSYEHWDKGVEYAQQKTNEFLQKAYHKPADEVDDSWDYSGAAQDAQLFYEVGLQLSNDGTWPKWKEGSEFKSVREQ